MGNMKTQQNTCFWKEINEYNILIPNYQRDYAQGRKDGGRIDNIRQIFVSELYQALSEDDAKCHLGLVFGSYNDDTKTFVAVDGQQRLTTVFLLHWFVAWKENRLQNYAGILKKFAWNTRSYSSQFVNLLFTLEPSDDVISAITENCNYFSVWENDPTVKSMKIMLKEIENQYPNKQQLCDSLFSVGCKIQYDILKLEKESDARTYLKMNSRGRPLTTFENFKSNLITYFEIETKKFDNEWLDFMLERSKTEDGGFRDPDVQFMNYINEYTYLQSKLKEQNDSKLFIEAKLKDGESDVPFISFEKYKSVFDKDIIEKFEKSLDWITCNYDEICNYDAIKKIDRQISFDSDFYLDKIIKDIQPNYSHRVKFFSLLKYAELSEYSKLDSEQEQKSFERWTRVFRNLVENSDIYENNMSDVCESINKIKDKDIYSYLSNGNTLESFNQAQVNEEIEKARQIIKDESWETKIIEAEKYAFFKGAIRFLFMNASGNVDWDSFPKKWVYAQEYFNENGGDELNYAHKEKNLLKSFINSFDEDKYFELPFVYESTKDNWRQILLDKRWSNPVHQLLTNDISVEKMDYIETPNLNSVNKSIKQLCVSGELLDMMPNGYYKKGDTLHQWYYWDDFRFSDSLTKIFEEIKEIGSIKSENLAENFGYVVLKGPDINFKYGNFCFILRNEKELILCNDESFNTRLVSESKIISKMTDEITKEKIEETCKDLIAMLHNDKSAIV